MKAIIKKLFLLSFMFAGSNTLAMQEWIRTNLTNLGLTPPKLSPTQELQQIIERQGSFKNVGLKKVQELIAMQADMNISAQGGQYAGKTPLELAIADYTPAPQQTDQFFIVDAIARVSDVNRRDKRGLTPVAIASYEGKVALIPLLIKRGADVKLTDTQGNTALHWTTRVADQKNAIAVARILLDAGININAQNNTGQTALMRAVQADRYQLIEFLVNAGADVHLSDNQGQTAIGIARAKNDQRALGLLTGKTEKML